MSSNKVGSRLSIIIGLVIFAILATTILARHVVAGPGSPSSPQSSGWVVQDNTIFGDRIAMVSADDGWMLKLGFHENLDDNSVYLYRWNGSKWSLFTSLLHTQLVIGADLAMFSETEGWLVLGGAPRIGFDPFESAIYRWDGVSWTKFLDVRADNGVMLKAVDMISPLEGWATGESRTGTIHYYWNGIQSQALYDTFEGKRGDDIEIVSSTDIWSIGLDGIAYWNGINWDNVQSPAANRLFGIDMIGPNEGWIAGENGTILHWDGTNWSEVVSPVGESLYAVDMISSNDGWIVGENGTMLHWDGQSWNQDTDHSIYPYDWLSIDMLSSNSGWIAGFGGVLVFETHPELSINTADGSPGSFFTISGSDYPVNAEATVNVNGRDLGTVTTDENGGFTLILSTAEADEGIYNVTVSVNPSATIRFVLDNDAPLRPKEGEGTEIAVPAGIALTEQLFLPTILR